MKRAINRRHFLGSTAASLAATASAMSALSYARINGANDRVNLAFPGVRRSQPGSSEYGGNVSEGGEPGGCGGMRHLVLEPRARRL